MDFHRLEEFIKIAEYKNIRMAADYFQLSPATLAARLKNFEHSLGTTLFDRTHASLTLTTSGEHFLAEAVRILDDYKDLKSRLLTASQISSYHTLRICVCGSGLPFFLGPFLDTINLIYPDVHIDLLDDNTYGIIDGLNSGNVDIYFSPSMSSFQKTHAPLGDIIRQQYNTAHQSVIVPSNHRLARVTNVTLKDLNGEQFILYPQTKESCIRDFQIKNLKDSKIRYDIYETESSSDLYRLLVPIGKGIVIHPNHLINPLPNAVSIPLIDIPHEAPACLFYKKENRRPDVTRFINDFLNFVKEHSQNEHRKDLRISGPFPNTEFQSGRK